MIDNIIEVFNDYEVLKIDGFDSAIIGFEEKSYRLIYSIKKIIEILKKDMDELDAIEYFEFNIYNSYIGEHTPIYSYDKF